MRLQRKVEIKKQSKANSEKHDTYKICAAVRITATVCIQHEQTYAKLNNTSERTQRTIRALQGC